jgi:hypothetical protein
MIRREVYEYETDKKTTVIYQGDVTSWHKQIVEFYNAEDKLIRRLRFDRDVAKPWTEEFSYDTQGLIRKETWYSREGEVSFSGITTYQENR